MPKASVIVSAYNAESFIEETIDSILAQTFNDFEIIIVNDGSTDGTTEVINSIKDPRIKLIEQANSGGPAKPRNVGIDASKGEYIFVFDSDDLMHPDKLELSISAMENFSSADLLFTNFKSIDESGKIINDNFLGDHYTALWNLVSKDSKASLIDSTNIFPGLVRTNFIGTSSVAIRRSSLQPEDRFNENLKNSDDRLFWISFARKHNFIFLNEKLHKYRVQQNSISNMGFTRRADSKIKALKIVLEYCNENTQLHSYVRKQISEDYGSLSYALRKSGQEYESFRMALRAASYDLGFNSIKHFLGATKAIFRRILL